MQSKVHNQAYNCITANVLPIFVHGQDAEKVNDQVCQLAGKVYASTLQC